MRLPTFKYPLRLTWLKRYVPGGPTFALEPWRVGPLGPQSFILVQPRVSVDEKKPLAFRKRTKKEWLALRATVLPGFHVVGESRRPVLIQPAKPCSEPTDLQVRREQFPLFCAMFGWLPTKTDWRMVSFADQKPGQIRGIPGSRGILRATDGMLCLIERYGQPLFEGHADAWLADDGGTLRVKKNKKEELFDELIA